jgi:two-component system sensor histidine kinase YesM
VKNGEYECIECYEGKDEIGKMIGSYNIMVNRVRDLIEVVLKGKTERQALELAKKQAELNALQSQVNPHFMFNALESIRMKSFVNGEKETADIIGELAMHMRSTIRWEVDFVTIQDEIAFIKSYLQIQKYRFGDRLEYSLHVQKECEQLRIPKFGILTFVENSCVHGIEKKIEGGNVNVIVMKDGDKMHVEIMDNGMGMEEDKLEELRNNLENASVEQITLGGRIGIMNAFIRLKMYYQDKIECQIDSKINEGTDVYFTVSL